MSEGKNWIHIEESLVIDARAEELYAVIADYKVGHPAILPKEFGPLTVEQGGTGAGTIFRTYVEMMGRRNPLHAEVTEPEPGRLLIETDIDTGQLTKFIVEPLDGGAQTRVTFASDFPAAPGLVGMLMRMMMPGMIRPMYRVELNNLAGYVRGKVGQPA